MNSEKKTISIDDFTPIAKLTCGYELKPGHAYLILFDGKDFSSGLAAALMKDIREMHPNVEVAMVVTSKTSSIEVREKKLADPGKADADPENKEEAHEQENPAGDHHEL
jgi:hypothetical protein